MKQAWLPQKQKQAQKDDKACCLNCGISHECGKCPPKGQKCVKCGRIGHWGKMCLNPNNPVSQAQTRKPFKRGINAVQNAPDDELAATFENLTFDVVNIAMNACGNNTQIGSRSQATATIQVEPYAGVTTNLRGKVDTGAEGNILPLRTFQKMFPRYISDEGHPLKTTPSSASLTDYNVHEIAQYGTITMPCTYRDRQHREHQGAVLRSGGRGTHIRSYSVYKHVNAWD